MFTSGTNQNLLGTRAGTTDRGAQTFFERKKGGLRVFLGEKKGGGDFFWKKKKGARTFFGGKKGGRIVFFIRKSYLDFLKKPIFGSGNHISRKRRLSGVCWHMIHTKITLTSFHE